MAALRAIFMFLVGAACGLGLAKLTVLVEASMNPERTKDSPVGTLVAVVAAPILGFVFAMAFGNLKKSEDGKSE